jgi:hypothetical protein
MLAAAAARSVSLGVGVMTGPGAMYDEKASDNLRMRLRREEERLRRGEVILCIEVFYVSDLH